MPRSYERRRPSATIRESGGARFRGWTPADARTVLFATSNENKFAEASAILAGLGIKCEMLRCELEEVQSCSLPEIAARKAESAAAACGREWHVIAEDDGLFVDALRGFPGPYAAYVHETVGAAALRRLLPRGAPAAASFTSAVSYEGPIRRAIGGGRRREREQGRRLGTGERGRIVFMGEAKGAIAARPRGSGWGYDPVFVPAGGKRTFAEMGGSEKNAVSHRRAALSGFAAWFAANASPSRGKRAGLRTAGR